MGETAAEKRVYARFSASSPLKKTDFKHALTAVVNPRADATELSGSASKKRSFPLISWEIILVRIASALSVIALGWCLRKLGVLAAEAVRPLCRLVLDVALPALIVTRLIAHVSADELREAWHWPLLGAGLVAFSQLICTLCVRPGRAAHRPTLIFSSALPNWFYLALAVLEPAFGMEATRILLLFNVGIHAWVWTAGILPFNEKSPFFGKIASILTTPPFLATAVGLAVLLAAPEFTAIAATPPDHIPALPWTRQALVTLWHVLNMLADIAIPLSLLTVGAQLAGATLAGRGGPGETIWGATLRLAIVPALTLAAMAGACKLGWRPSQTLFFVMFLTSAMPTAVVVGQVAELHQGDPLLAGRLTFLTTLLSLATVPLWSVGAGAVWRWLGL